MTLPSDLAAGALRRPMAEGAPHPIRVVTSVTSRTVLGSMVGLLVWAHLPVVALGWTAGVVQSGSMRPALTPGDVVLYQPPPRDRTPAVGQIVLAQDPTRPGHLLTHRVYQVLPNNDLIIKGDANSAPDSTPLRPAALQGVARLRVPWIGLPVQLWRARQLVPAAIVLLGLTVLLALAALPLRSRSQHT
ncbi:S26 family signal peptidase [Streptomyces sp. AK02-01A]|uniref:S26 family signal peptidase n=1 Tax=Streptomyces sp. AK02-01A TaxID=3028648 RepID=UPI0029A12B0B|nr:S26 family signal peptidase [Streptomyces sp. AK02-01A]MDX3850249.1 S26 family signal peptidase [Streptomyces sp. AK02-01A]